jgi:hypothetical protein
VGSGGMVCRKHSTQPFSTTHGSLLPGTMLGKWIHPATSLTHRAGAGSPRRTTQLCFFPDCPHQPFPEHQLCAWVGGRDVETPQATGQEVQ